MKPKNYRYEIQDCELSLEGYEVFHNMRKEGRGIVLYVKEELKASMVEELESEAMESIFVDCRLQDNKTLRVGLMYRSPNSSAENNEALNDLLSKASDQKNFHLLVMGDFNYKEIDWDRESVNANIRKDNAANNFVQTVKKSYLFQHVREPTRQRDGQKENILDLIFTNRDDIVQDIYTTAGLGKSDHLLIVVEMKCRYDTAPSAERYAYQKTDFDILNECIKDNDWENDFKDKNINDSWNHFKEKLNEAIKKSTPKVKTRGNRKKNLDPETLEIVKNKHRMYRKWKKTGLDEDKANYKRANNQARKACRSAEVREEKRVAKESKENPNQAWRFIKSKTTTRTGVSDLRMSNGEKTKSDKEKAETLNTFFQSVFTKEEFGPVPKPPEREFEEDLTDFEIQEKEVKKILESLHPGKAPGPDGINPFILSKAAASLTLPVTLLYRKSLQEGNIPEEWRKATVTPIFKKGSRAEPCNYRPVSLTCILCKCLERLVRANIMEHLQRNNLIAKEQHGFVPGRSCCTQLLETLDDWTQVLDEGGTIDAVYMDFQKAFDTVPHRRLLAKISAYGIEGNVLKWIEAFLSNRTQRVVVGGDTSNEADVWSGIPQGSVLGPLLFVIFINDLPDKLSSVVKMFADDTKVYTRSDAEGSTEQLQNDLHELENWSSSWLLKFHPQKCCIMKIGPTKSESDYEMGSCDKEGNRVTTVLKETKSEKDLGVVVDDKLIFQQHVDQCTAKANRTVGIIRRSFNHLSEQTFTLLFKSLVRPILEYGNIVWQPMSKGLCSQVEDVQRRATKLLGHIKNLSYPERLMKLKLPSLEFRRLRGSMIEVYKFVNGYYDVNQPKFERDTSERNLRGHSLKLTKKRYKLKVRGNFFSNRVVNSWNSLPNEVVTAASVNSFKNRLDKHWRQHPALYHPTCQE